jgi:glycine/D-amino acid oxidase-like deaminating enzyme
MERAIVIGGGIVGVSVAWRLAETGMQVTLLDAGGLGQGASLASFAWLNGSFIHDRDYFLLKLDGLGEYHALARELGATPWLHEDGHIEWSSAANETVDSRGADGLPVADAELSGTERLRKKVRTLREWGFPAELLPIRELRSLEPDLQASPGVEEFAWYPQEGYIEPVDAIGALALEARQHGATIIPNAPVASLVIDGDCVTGVVTRAGETFHADWVISCAGSWTPEVLRMAGSELAMSPVDGMVAVSGPTAARLRVVHHNEALSLRPDGAGRIMMRHYDFDRLVDASAPPRSLPDWTGDLMARAVRSLPELAASRIEAVRVGTRPIPADGLPAVGPVPGVDGLYVVAAHGAVTLAPLLGRLVSREIARNELVPRLAPFRPDRLMTPRA